VSIEPGSQEIWHGKSAGVTDAKADRRNRVSLVGSSIYFAATPIDADPRANGTFVAPIPDAPFTAVDKMEQTRIDPHGSIVKLKTTRAIARDSQGRVYKDRPEE
jgi:hypothetical protein